MTIKVGDSIPAVKVMQANVSNDALVKHLRDWCERAEASGIRALQDFSARLRGYVPQPA